MKKNVSIIFIVFVSILLLSTDLFDIRAYATANELTIGTPVRGSQTNCTSYSYNFRVDTPGKLTITFSTECDTTTGSFSCSVTGIVGAYTTSWTSINGNFSYTITKYLEKGNYAYNFSCSGNGTYTIDTQFECAKESFEETQTGADNTADAANTIILAETYYGLIMDSDLDVYRFNIAESSSIDISLNCYPSTGWFSYTIYDDKLNVVTEKNLRYYDKYYGDTGAYSNTHDLDAGNYYLLIKAAGGDFGGPYDFSIKTTHTVHVYDNDCDPECNICSQVRSVTHNFEGWTTLDNTSHKHTCLTCRKEETAAHSWDNGNVTKQPTCAEDGLKTHTCSGCSGTKTEAISKTNEHKYDSWIKVDDNTHKHSCSVCKAEELFSHSWDNGNVTKPPTCTEEGVNTYTCSDCGAHKEEAIPEIDHNWKDATCETAKTCTVCGKIDGTPSGHSYSEWSEMKAPTTEELGLEERICASCGNQEQRPLDKLEAAPTDPNPTIPVQIIPGTSGSSESGLQNNDNPSVFLVIVILALCGIGVGSITTLIVLKKK